MKRALLVVGVSLILMSSAQAGPSIITNGSFEQDQAIAVGSYKQINPGDTSITGWIVGPVNVDWVGTYWTASDGARSLDLNGYVGSGVIAAGSVEQTFATAAGQWYNVTFDMAANPAGGTSSTKSLQVSADGSSANFSSSANPKDGQWDTMTWSFLADGNTTLKFASLMTAPGDNGWGPALDNVSVTAVPVPAPGALLLGSLGAAMVGAIRRRALRA
jgi:choice-of-anchor C domain-containing protein